MKNVKITALGLLIATIGSLQADSVPANLIFPNVGEEYFNVEWIGGDYNLYRVSSAQHPIPQIKGRKWEILWENGCLSMRNFSSDSTRSSLPMCYRNNLKRWTVGKDTIPSLAPKGISAKNYASVCLCERKMNGVNQYELMLGKCNDGWTLTSVDSNGNAQ